MKITEDRISELANRSIECIQSEQRGKKTEKKEQSLRDLWDNNKEKKNQIFVLLEFQEEKECGIEMTLKKIITENVS